MKKDTPAPKPGWTWFCSLSSWLVLLTFFTMAAHVRLGLGHWPTPMAENYDTMAFRIHAFALIASFMFTLYAAGPLWMLLLFFQRFRLPWRVHIAQATLYGMGWLALLMVAYFDPTTFTDWFMD